MRGLNNHIVLIGFKNVGKSIIGKVLAKRLNCDFIDLDNQVELLYFNQFHKNYSCRQIMQEHSKDYFNCLEINALRQIINNKPSVFSIGGGAAMIGESQRIIKCSLLVHIIAPAGIVFERIQMGGRPAFFDPRENLLESFNKLWEQRIKVYENIADFSILNNGSVDDAVNKIVSKINLGECWS